MLPERCQLVIYLPLADLLCFQKDIIISSLRDSSPYIHRWPGLTYSKERSLQAVVYL
jgi:hypothetical protein